MSMCATSRTAAPYTLLSDLEVENLPPVSWLVAELIPAKALVLLFGVSGIGKSFFAQETARAVASGLPCFGRAVMRGPVVYVCAEGQGGLPQRLRAWRHARGVEGTTGVRFGLVAVDLLDDASVAAFLTTLRDLPAPPALVVFDTYSRSLGGGSDSEARHVSQAIAVFDDIIREFGATVLVVHHPGRSESDRLRGSSIVDGAADAILLLRRPTSEAKRRRRASPSPPPTDRLVLETHKQKDGVVGEALHLRLVAVEGQDGAPGSCVMELADAPPRGAEEGAQHELTPNQRTVLAALAKLPPAGARYAEWKKAASVAETSFDDSMKALRLAGHVEQAIDGRRWQISASGRALLGDPSSGTPADPETTTDRGDRGGIAAGAVAGTPEPRRTPKRPQTGVREGIDPEPRATPASLIEGRGSGWSRRPKSPSIPRVSERGERARSTSVLSRRLGMRRRVDGQRVSRARGVGRDRVHDVLRVASARGWSGWGPPGHCEDLARPTIHNVYYPKWMVRRSGRSGSAQGGRRSTPRAR